MLTDRTKEGGPEDSGAERLVKLELIFDREQPSITIGDGGDAPVAAARAAVRGDTDGAWWSSIRQPRGPAKDFRHDSRGAALEAMVEAATGLALDPAAVAAGMRHVEREQDTERPART